MAASTDAPSSRLCGSSLSSRSTRRSSLLNHCDVSIQRLPNRANAANRGGLTNASKPSAANNPPKLHHKTTDTDCEANEIPMQLPFTAEVGGLVPSGSVFAKGSGEAVASELATGRAKTREPTET